MPEGDTIYRAAVNLRAAMEGRVVDDAEAHGDLACDQLIDTTVRGVEARGKHLLMWFDESWILHSHMGMTGSWHIYHPGEPWKKPPRRAAVKLVVREIVAVCFSPKIVELLSPTSLRRHRYLSRLGPDLLSTNFSESEALDRLRVHAVTPLGEAVMNQTIFCGVGNVYKSEVLFLNQLNPFRTVDEFEDAQLIAFLQESRRLMLRNLAGYPRRTRFKGDSQRKWVYGRKGQPCFRCGTEIEMRRQGDLGRSTYFCPTCQGV